MSPQGRPVKQSAEAKAHRAQKRKEREAAEKQEATQLAARRAVQLEGLRAIVAKLDGLERMIQVRKRQREDLASHLEGFYEEVDKLAKGKSMLEVTTRVLDDANHVIRDAKAIASGDTYLDRLKEFVAAGDNPVYPDVVIAMRTVRQSLDRAAGRLDEELEEVEGRINEAQTLELVLLLHLETGDSITVRTVKERMVGDEDTLDLSWFIPDVHGMSGDYRLFDFARLDTVESLEDHFLADDNQ